MLVLAGLGLTEKGIPLRALEAVNQCDEIYAEFYTNTAHSLSWLEDELGQPITECSREDIEQPEQILAAAQQKDVAVLVSGDPLAATTHVDLLQQAKEHGIDTDVFHAPSIFTAIAETGLSLYRFGRVTTLPSPDKGSPPPSIYRYTAKNVEADLHSLILLDIDLRADTALTLLQELEQRHGNSIFTVDTDFFVCERLGTDTATVHRGTLQQLQGKQFGEPPHSIIRPASLSANEERYAQ